IKKLILKEESCFLIGDIHACLNTFKKLIKLAPKKSKIISVGDIVNKGKFSRKTIKYFRNNPDILVVRGNHEDNLIKSKEFIIKLIQLENIKDSLLKKTYISKKDSILNSIKYKTDWGYTNYLDVLSEYENNLNRLLKDIEWLETLPFLIIIENILNKEGKKLLVSHSLSYTYFEEYNELLKDFEQNKELIKKMEINLLWNRKLSRSCKNNKTNYFNIFGHTPVDNYDSKKYSRIQGKEVIPEPFIDLSKSCANIDTGCFDLDRRARGWLTAIEWPSLKHTSVFNID
ncbi:hypothetical protein HOK00_09525, partial [bacterium]|nr:hypothetical protein [bacterium]